MGDGGTDATTDQFVAPDTSLGDASDAATGPCTLSKPFGAPVVVSAIDVFPDQEFARLSHDGLTVYFNAGGVLQVATRASVSAPFGTPTALLDIDGGAYTTNASAYPTVTFDALTLYGGTTTIYYATRASPTGSFGALTPVPTLSAPTATGQPFAQDPSNIWFVSQSDIDGGAGAGGMDIYHATIIGEGATSNVVHVSELATARNEYQPTVTPDGLTIYFARNADPADGGPSASYAIYTASRTSTAMPFSNPVPVDEVNIVGASQRPSFISADGCVLWFESNAASDGGAYEIYTATKPL